MSLRLPGEIVAERFVPTARAMLARELADRGETQRDVAAFLGVTQAAVSNYVSGDAPTEDRFADDERMQRTVERIADGWVADELDAYEALVELFSLVREFEDRGPICELHEEEMPALAGLGCDLCVRGTDAAIEAERAVLRSVRKAARRLATAPGAAAHVPNVGTNVAMALPNPSDRTDVAAIPGRLHATQGRVRIPADPEFGASEHVARTLLVAADADPSVRGALNLATSDRLLDAARARGVDPVEFDAAYEDRAAELRDRFADGVPRVAYHAGAFGVEPVCYVFGASALDAAEFAASLFEADDAVGDRP